METLPKKGRKLNTLSNNIKCGNSLIDDSKVAGEKAFNWQNEFSNIFKEKKKKVWHITTATHNSRYSQRMFDYNIKTDEAIWLTDDDEIIITETIAEIVKNDNLNVIEYNICGDHMHLLLVCEADELTKIVGKIKGKTARLRNSNKGINPLVRLNGEESVSLWTQKFGKSEIKDEDYLNNAIEYIRNNRVKHKLPKSEKIETIKEKFLCTKEHSLRTEYTGGFDVVIGNPPYGASFPEKDKEFIVQNYKSYQYKFESYLYFYEKGIQILKNNGFLSFITPELFLRLEKSENIRKYIFDNSELKELKFCGENVFADVKVNSVVLTLLKRIKTKKPF